MREEDMGLRLFGDDFWRPRADRLLEQLPATRSRLEQWARDQHDLQPFDARQVVVYLEERNEVDLVLREPDREVLVRRISDMGDEDPKEAAADDPSVVEADGYLDETPAPPPPAKPRDEARAAAARSAPETWPHASRPGKADPTGEPVYNARALAQLPTLEDVVKRDGAGVWCTLDEACAKLGGISTKAAIEAARRGRMERIVVRDAECGRRSLFRISSLEEYARYKAKRDQALREGIGRRLAPHPAAAPAQEPPPPAPPGVPDLTLMWPAFLAPAPWGGAQPTVAPDPKNPKRLDITLPVRPIEPKDVADAVAVELDRKLIRWLCDGAAMGQIDVTEALARIRRAVS